MKRLYFLLVAGLMLSGCTTVNFEQPVPLKAEALQAFPERITGTYVERQNKDTLVITADGFRYGRKGDLFYLTGHLKDENTVLKKSGDFYLLSMREKDDPFWEVMPFRLDKGQLTVYALLLEDKPDGPTTPKDEKLKKLGEITPVKVVHTKTGDRYVINPQDDQLERLLGSGLFDKVTVFEKVE